MKQIVIIPAFNESGAIVQTIKAVKRSTTADILVINDGSLDDTALKAQQEGVLVISLAVNLGIGGAVQTGLQYAQAKGYDVAIQVDGDGQHDPTFIPTMINEMVNAGAGLVVGSRFKELNKGFQSTFTRRLGIKFFVGLINALTGMSVTDPTSGFRCYDRRSMEIFSYYYPTDFPEPEALVIAYRHGLRIVEVPVVMKERLAGLSSIGKIKSGYYMLKVSLAVLLAMIRRKQNI
jgi:glycosyltransferase involved in cell wall biosynthesis